MERGGGAMCSKAVLRKSDSSRTYSISPRTRRLPPSASSMPRITTTSKTVHSYQGAIKALNSLQSNFSILEAIRKSGQPSNQNAIPEMLEWCARLGYQAADFEKLNAIHVAGTKGKGSTSAFVSSILSQYRPSITKVGLYTSPHLRFVRERISIDDKPISEATFAKYFGETWDRLEDSAGAKRPVYFRYLTLMALHTFLSEGVDAAIMECGVGGEYDSTNVLRPRISAITSLGLDHIDLLGPRISDIAWHKAGIMKPGVPAFTVSQPKEAMVVLRERAREKGVELTVVDQHPQIQHIELGLAGDFQETNASLAIAVAAAFLDLKQQVDTDLPQEFIRGLQEVRLGGRCEIRTEHSITWHLDGAHTRESLEVAAQWFASGLDASDSDNPRILLFNQQTRSAVPLLAHLYETLRKASIKQPFTHAIFSSNLTSASGYQPDLISINANASEVDNLSVQNDLALGFRNIDDSCQVFVMRNIEEAMEQCRQIARATVQAQAKVLVTGSFHLVGGVLEILERQGPKPSTLGCATYST